MQQVWILSKGGLGNGGDVVGVYADKELGAGEFVGEMAKMHFPVNDIEQREDGGFYVTAGCDFLSLEPHQLIVRNEIEN